MTIIPLRPSSLTASSDLPGGFGRAALERLPIWSCSVRGFACHFAYAKRGALLPHHFTLTASCPAHCARADCPGPSCAGAGALVPGSLGGSWRRDSRRRPLPHAISRTRYGGIFSVPLS